jgi:hypothetical protein
MVRTFYPVRIESNKVSPDLDESEKKGDHQVHEENVKRQKSKGKSKSKYGQTMESRFLS